MKLQRLLSYVRRACDDYNMIEENDKIAVSLSGGKDSTALLIALSQMRRFYPVPYTLEAVTVSLGLPGSDFSAMQTLCDKLAVPYTIINTDIGKIIFDIRKEKNPCSLCTKMRKGAFNEFAHAQNFNKVAYGHNKEDVIETLFLSLFYEGRIYSFSPKSYLDRKELHAIRPLIYAPEKEIIGFINKSNIPLSNNKCIADGNTKRQHIKEFIANNSKEYGNFEDKIFGAIQRSDISGWQRDDGYGKNLL